MIGAYTIRKVPKHWLSSGKKSIDFALLDPAGQYIAGSWNPENLRRLRDQLNDAYELGLVTGRLQAKGKLDRKKTDHLKIVLKLPLVTDEGQYRAWHWFVGRRRFKF